MTLRRPWRIANRQVARVLAPYPTVEKVLVDFEAIDEETGMPLIAEIFSRRN